VRKNKRSSVVLAKKSSIVATEIALAMMAAQLAYAQQPVQTTERVERVEITGSRLPQLNVEGASPVTQLGAQDIKFDGAAKTEDLLNQLPQVNTSQGSGASNDASGTANVNMRNLGVNRNLVLLNGRRLPPGSPRSGAESYAADLNQIPAALIQRVELLTGGASAVYGSDAISGVVNFIMNDRFEGVQVDIGHSFNQHKQHNDKIANIIRARAVTNPSQFSVPGDVRNDGQINDYSILIGRNFADNRGNATLFFGYKQEDPVLQRDRDFSACSLDTPAAPNPLRGKAFICGGSSTSFPGRWFLDPRNPAGGPTFSIDSATGLPRPFSSATDQFNFGPYNYYRRPSEQYSFSAFAHLDVIPSVRAYSEFGFHDNQTVAQIAPSGIFVGNPDFLVPRAIRFENPLLTPAWIATIAANNGGNPFAATGDTAEMLIGRRNVEGGGRQDDIRHTSYRGVLGIKGDVAKHWNYDAFLQTGKVLYQNVYRNDFSKIRAVRATDAITGPALLPDGVTANPKAGLIQCRSEWDGTDAACVPYDIWTLGQVTPEALNYLQTPGFQSGRTTQDVIGATASADLGAYGIKMPAAKNGVAVVLGVERRKERLVLETDTAFSTFDLAGQGGPTIGVNGQLGVEEIFGEVRVPFIEGRPYADLLSVSASYRHSDYTTNKKTNTYGFGVEWAPVRNYRFRGSYQHAIRHPNIVELFQPLGNNLFGMDEDPCGAAMLATLAQCQRSGLPIGLYGSDTLDSPAGQYNFLEGGVATLNPEKADSVTLGLVFTPTRDLTGTIDLYSIKVKDAIDSPPPSFLLLGCLRADLFCNLIQRDSLGTLWALPSGKVIALNDNTGGYKTTGVDLALNYTRRLGALGNLGLHFLGTYVHKWEFEPVKNIGFFDCVGLIGPSCSDNRGPHPEWRHKLRATWATPWSLDLAVTWRHIAEVKHEASTNDPLLNPFAKPVFDVDRTLGARDYLDIAGIWSVNKTLTLRAGVNNVFDRDPPIVTNIFSDPAIFGNGNTFPGMYDALGRTIFIALTVKL
jgi:iron complex outermembrane recepter protein